MAVDEAFRGAIASRYRIERELGEGGMAVVYLARDPKHGRLVALKVLRPELSSSLGAERFLQEIAIAARLVHPNILPLHDSGDAGGRLFYVMPFVEGSTLRQRLDREGPLPLEDAASIVMQVAAALDHAHARGIVHRDVKPDNVLLVDGRVLVADFGLARALTTATSSPLTRTGMVVGTPAYMSPEQCSPGETVDARSDVYALACMAFEMLAGVTPFRGANAQAMIAHQVSGEPPSVCAERPRCPASLDDVLRRGLAKSPADRYQKAGDFASAFEAAIREDIPAGSPAAGVPSIPPRRARRWLPTGALVVTIAAAGWFVSQRALGARPALDRDTYAVFPFRHVGVTPNPWLDGDGCAQLLHDAMARWDGIRLVDDMRVGDVWSRRQPRTVDEAMRAAESLHAGALAWGEVRPVGDSLEIRAVAYDLTRGAGTSREFKVRVAQNATQMDSVFAALADSIVIGGTGVRGTSALGTHNFHALNQFLDGREALDRFDLPLAEDRFSAATQTDDNYAQAHLWAARVRAWRGNAQPSSWLADASRAVALSRFLPSREAAHALALRDLAEGHATEACRRYRALTIGDSTDFAAWLGLGDCNARDNAVVRDARSPTGFAFRGSYYTAVKAYQRALALVPSFHQAERGLAFQRLTGRVLSTEEASLRRGTGVPPDTQAYVSFPSFVGDTLAFVPVPYALAPRVAMHPATENRAVTWSAQTMRDLMAEWVAAFPGNPDAQAGYASALESVSELSGTRADLAQALELMRQSASHTDSADLRLYRQVAVVRLLLKSDSTASAAALADSLLSASRSPTPYQAAYLGNLAALTGQGARAAAFLTLAASDTQNVPFLGPDGRRLILPADVMGGILSLRAYAALGAPRDSVSSTFARVDRLLARSVAAPARGAMRRRVFATAAVLAPGDLDAANLAGSDALDPLLAMRGAIARGNIDAARAAGARFETTNQGYAPGTIGIDRSTAYAAMLLSLGDTAAAIHQLDGALDALPRARSILLEATPQAASLGRAFLLRSQLALRAGDGATARRNVSVLAALWRRADPAVRAPLDSLQRQL